MFWRKLLLLIPLLRRARERELQEELQMHQALAEEQALDDGATGEEARFFARCELGSVLRAQEDSRSVWGFSGLDALGRDCAYAIRGLRQSPTFTVTAIVSLGIGVGSAAAIFSLLNGVLLKPLPYRDPEQIVAIREVVQPFAGMYPSMPVNYQHFLFWQEHSRSFASLAAIRGYGGTVYLSHGSAEPVALGNVQVSANLFALFGVNPQIGRSFLSDEGKRGHDNVVIITDSLWKRSFRRDPTVIGRKISLSFRPYTVIGVLPANFWFPKNSEFGALVSLSKSTDVFMPLDDRDQAWDGDYDYVVLGRLKPHIPMRQAIAELNLLEHQIDDEHHLNGLHILCEQLQDVIAGPVRTPLYMLMTSILLLLVIVCANLTNLVLARSTTRIREFSIRSALGAGKGRLIQQILIETLFLSIAGGLIGLLFAAEAVHLFVLHTPVQIPRLDGVRIDLPVFSLLCTLSLLCGLAAGLIPAVRLADANSQDSLRATGHSLVSHKQALRMRELLIGCEVAISAVLLFGAGLLAASLAHVTNADKGFTQENAISVDVILPWVHYNSDDAELRFWDAALSRLRSVPGAKSVAFTSKLPLTGESMVNDVVLDGADQAAIDPTSRANVEINVRYVSPDYFRTLGIPVLAGRSFDELDRRRVLPTAVSARLASRLWPGQDPIGKVFSTGADVGKVVVVAVVKDVHATALDRDPTLTAYVPYWHQPLGSGTLLVRTNVNPAVVCESIRKNLRELDAQLPPPEIKTMESVVSESLSKRYFQVRLSGAFAAMALILAIVGIYGVTAYSAAQRKTEIALRMALGARPGDVFSLLIRRGFRPVVAGVLAGLVFGLLLAQFIRTLLFGVKTTDPFTIVVVIAILAAAAGCACLLPAQRALRTDPAAILRHD